MTNKKYINTGELVELTGVSFFYLTLDGKASIGTGILMDDVRC